MSESYYLKKIPQSEYRRVEDGGQSAEERGTFIDLELRNVEISDPGLKQALINKIFSEGQTMIQVLLPEDHHESALTQDHLQDIYQRLGLI